MDGLCSPILRLLLLFLVVLGDHVGNLFSIFCEGGTRNRGVRISAAIREHRSVCSAGSGGMIIPAHPSRPHLAFKVPRDIFFNAR